MEMEYFLAELEQLKKDVEPQINMTLENDKYLLKSEFIHQMNNNELLIYKDPNTNIKPGMILESAGYLKNDMLVVNLSSEKSTSVIGIYQNEYSISNNKFADVLILTQVKMGDLITSSHIPGYGIKQEDDIVTNCTVGKVISFPKKINDVFTVLIKLC